MKVTIVSSSCPGDTPSLSPELLAATLARYSRNNTGIHKLIESLDLSSEAGSASAVDRIFKFTDYGHASIGDMTGALTLAFDGVTMVGAYFLFAAAPYGAGQESSTRYIKMDESSLPSQAECGLSDLLFDDAQGVWKRGLELYQIAYEKLDAIARETPEKTRIPTNMPEKVRDRMLKNFALDRARNFLPFALKTNVAVMQSARAWCETSSKLRSYGAPELLHMAIEIEQALARMAPRLAKHAKFKRGCSEHWHKGVPKVAGRVSPNQRAFATVLSLEQLTGDGMELRENRYDECPPDIQDAVVGLHIPSLAIAELRDLNRHRTGSKRVDLRQARGLELCEEITELMPKEAGAFVQEAARILRKHEFRTELPWLMPLGTTVPFSHTMAAAKFAYEAELRTGPGAHFRYAQHLRAAVASLYETPHSGFARRINLGQAEPE